MPYPCVNVLYMVSGSLPCLNFPDANRNDVGIETSSASVPIAFCEAREAGRVEKGKLIVMCAFGAGLVWGGTLIRW